jgi:predicted anti-sigma-YlaC factor YlaD
MSCDDYQKDFSKLMDNELGEEACALLFTHMGTCSTCREFFRTSMLIQSELDELRVPEPRGLSGFNFERAGKPARTRDFLSFVRKFRDTRIPLSFATAAIVVAMAGTIAVSSLWFQTSREPVQHSEKTVYSYLLSPVYVEAQPSQQNAVKK